MNNSQPAKKPKILRQVMPEQPPDARIRTFGEVALGYTPELAVLEAGRCLQCKNPKCIDGCPVGIDIPGFLKLIVNRDFIGAAKKLREFSDLPAVCGRVCPQEEQCEKYCIVGIKNEPVAVGRLERFAADCERAEAARELPKLAPKKNKRIAIVGSGPAGLTAAGELLKRGYDVTVFEALHEPGGVLMYGIPEFRLPKEIVRYEIDILKRMGAEIKSNQIVGRTFTIDDLLKNGYEAVFIGAGAGLPILLNLPGEHLNGVYSANEFLIRVNLMRAYDFPNYHTPVFCGKRVAVLGGGNVAMDAARVAQRLKPEKVYIVYRRTEKEMPARLEEVHHGKEEGVEFMMLCAPTKILGDEKGWVKGLELQRMQLGEPDASGRRRPVPIPGSEFVLDVDMVVIAIGNTPNPIVGKTTVGLEVSKHGTIVANESGATTRPGVFAGGDIVTGAATVILAMGAGKKAAQAIDEYVTTTASHSNH
ncbi:MAG: NADPH-dependent glutamate synthase [Planctomycetota bacterium]